MMAFDFCRPLRAFARARADKQTLLGLALCLSISHAPWNILAQRRVLSADQAAMYRSISAQFQQQAALPDDDNTCFGQQMQGQAGLDNIKASTVLIGVVEVGKAGSLTLKWIGTGFIVANSSDGHDSNRIVTAAHVVTDSGQNSTHTLNAPRKIMVFGSNGVVIGTASVAAIGRDDLSKRRAGRVHTWQEVRPGDVAALHMEHFVPKARDMFDRIAGLHLEGGPGYGWILGHTDPHTPGIDSGHSGAPVIDRNTGRILGVMVRGESNDSFQQTYNTGNILKMVGSKSLGLLMEEIKLMPQDDFMAEVLPTSVLTVLGPEGRRAMQDRAQNTQGQISDRDVIVPGMPQNGCVITRAKVGPVLGFGTIQPLKPSQDAPAPAINMGPR